MTDTETVFPDPPEPPELPEPPDPPELPKPPELPELGEAELWSKPGFETDMLSLGECLALLASERIGRLAVDLDGQPDIFPVNYLLDGDRVVIRTDEGMKLRHASLDRVAFEVDRVDPKTGEAWSVVVKGTSREITTAIDAASERERELSLEPLGAEHGRHWLRIVPRSVTGRRIHEVRR